MSSSTLPAPTDGSWSASPTIISLLPSSKAFRKPSISIRSIIEASSTMKESSSSGFSAFLPNSISFSSSEYTYSRSLCIVIASTPEVSVIRLAARPVGAASATEIPISLKIFTMRLIIVVLPVPGPPVIIVILLVRAARIAFL